jgi:hypothetical protein
MKMDNRRTERRTDEQKVGWLVEDWLAISWGETRYRRPIRESAGRVKDGREDGKGTAAEWNGRSSGNPMGVSMRRNRKETEKGDVVRRGGPQAVGDAERREREERR